MNRKMHLHHQRGFLFLIWLSALLLSLFVQVPSAWADPGVHWEQTYGGLGYDEALSVIETKEGDLVFSGFIGNPTTSHQSVYLVKTDHAGNLIWENSFDGAREGGCYECVGASVCQTSDDGFVIAGSTKTVMESNDKIYLIKTDAAGNREWEKIMDLEAQGLDYTKRRAYAVKEAPDLGFIIAGSIQQNQQTETALVKTDQLGNVEWVQLFGNNGWDMFRSIEVTSDQGYVAAGHTEVDSRRYLYITKTDDRGHQVWAYVADRPNSQAREVRQTGDGGYIAAGYYGSNIYLLKLDGDGNKQWERSLGMPGANFGYSLDLTDDGGFILVGSNSNQGIYVAKTDGQGVLDWEKSFGKEATAYTIRQTGDGGYVLAGGKASDAYLLKIQQAETAYLGVSSPNVMDNGTVLVYATVMDKSGGRNHSGNADVKIKINGIEEKVELGDRGVSGDITAGDGVYSAWQKIIGPGPVSIELFLNDLKIDELEIKVIDDPELIMLSNLEPLYWEFTETGMTPEDDNNANDIPDFYDLLDRINQYASDHHGILFDLNQEIAGYQAKSYDSDAENMCLDIKEFVDIISSIHPFKYVAIIGDDEVVPMFRRYDGTNQEGGYPGTLGGDFGNRTLQDSALGYIMTDVPYGMYEALNNRPLLDAAVGRIFAKLPSTMINQIIANETALDVSDVSSAAIFSIRDEPHNFRWPLSIDLSLKPVLQKFAPGEVDPTKLVQEYTPGNCYWWDADLYPWGPKRYADAISQVPLAMIWGHATHIDYENTGNNWDPPAPLEYTHYDSMNAAPSTLIVTIGCHSGYHSSHQSDVGHFGPYGAGLVKSALEKEVSYLAPTTYGLRTGNSAQLHELIFKGFFNNLFDANTPTIGEAIKKAYRDYWMNTSPYWANDPNSAYSAYGTAYYGLPTRPLQHSANLRYASQALDLSEKEEGNDAQIQRASLQAAASQTMSITVDVPEFKVTQDEKGATLFEVPNDGTFVGQPFAPALPLITRSFLLPRGTTVNDVILAEQNSALYPEKVSLQVPPVINATLGELKGSFEVPNPYPEQIFWWNTFATEGGVMLNIGIVPMQYNPATGEVALYNHLKFSASLSTHLSATTFDSVTVNRGNPLEVNKAGLPIDLTINSPVDQDAILSFTIRDRSGTILGSSRKSVSLISGVTPGSLEFNTMNWIPGPKDLTIALSGDTVLATWNQSLDTAGINLESNLAASIYLPAETSTLLDVEVRNEQGIGVDDLEQGNFNLLLNGNPLAVTALENKGAGRYQLPISLVGLNEGFHHLDLTARDRRGMLNSDRNYFAIQADTETPVVKKTVPKKDAAGVDLEPVISLTFSEDIVESTAFADISIKTGEEGVGYTAQINGSTLTLTPASKLEGGSIYTITIPKCAVKDLAGNDIAWDYRFKFITYAGPDTITPVYAFNSPLEGTVDFPATARISIGFSESVTAGPLFADIAFQADDNPVAFTTTINGAQLMLIPNLPLPYASRCQVTIPAGALQDQAGNLLSAPFSLTFTVEIGPDSAPPQIVETIPVHDDQGVVPDALINIVFNEPIKKGSNIGDITWMAGDTNVAFAADIQGQTLTLTALNPLPLGTACTVTLPMAAVMDLSENQLASDCTFTYTTGDVPDTSSPQITRTIPSNEGQGVLLGTPVLICFDEAVQESTRFTEILWQTAGKNVTFNPVIDGRILTLTPGENLDYSLSYTVTVPTDAVKDLAGNTLDKDCRFTFTTGDSPDTIPPAIARTSPARDEEGIKTDALIYVIFDEAVQASAAFNTIKVESGGEAIGYNAVINGKTLTITPGNILNLNTVYQVTIPAGAVKDLSGNELAGELLYSFTTVAESEGDTTPPALSGSQPINNAGDIPVNQTITLTFSEPIIQGTSFGTISLQAGEVEVPLNVSFGRNTLTITPVTNLAYSTTYILTVPAGAVKDQAENSLTEVISLTFTTVAMIPTDKTLVNVSAPSAITGVANGTAKTAAALGLPAQVTLVTSDGNVEADVNWDVTGCSYDPDKTTEQTFSVTGTVTLPSGVVNPNNVDLTTSISITVNAAAPVPTFALTITAGTGGSVTTGSSGHYAAGTVINITATPAPGYSFNQWTSTGGGTFANTGDATTTFTMPANAVTITATFTAEGSSGAGGGGGTPAPPSGLLVTPAGRTANTSGVTLTFPVGAVEDDTRIQLTEAILTAGMTLPENSQLLSRVVDIIKDKSGSFMKPVTITLSFNKSGLDPNEYDMAIYYYDEAKGEWIALDNIRLNLEAGTISGDTNHFTKFAVIATPKIKKPSEITPPQSGNIPPDLTGHWAKDSIVKLIDSGVVAGYADGSFRPNKAVSRAEFTAMLVKALNLEKRAGITFTDTVSHWARDSIVTAAAHGIIMGYNQNAFGPDDPITREQAAVIVSRAAKLEGGLGGLNFIDRQAISSWAQSGVAAALKGGLITGYADGSFRPRGETTRAEAAAILAKLR